MSIFHVTLSQGRADTLYLYSSSASKVLSFLNSVSTAIVRNIKEVLYSKDLNVNTISYSPPVYVGSVPIYHKIIFTAYTSSYSKTFTLYNVKKSITLQTLRVSMMGLSIRDQKITSIGTVTYYDEVSVDGFWYNYYQVQYKRNSKTYIEDFYADSISGIYNLFKNIINGEIIEIRKYALVDSTIKADDGNYGKRIGAYITDDSSYMSFSIPKSKKGLSLLEIKSYIVSYLDFHNGKKIDFDKIKLTFK